MSIWGPELYQNDVALDVREYYKDQLHRGKNGTTVMYELMQRYGDSLSDKDDDLLFWFALADTQWNLGRLENFVKEKALRYIDEGGDLNRWHEECPEKIKHREKVLYALKQKLLSPQPPEKKISQYRLYKCEWKLGDVYAYPLDSEYAKECGLYGRYFLFYKIGETSWHPGHITPIVWVKITRNGELPKSRDEFDVLEYIQIASVPYEDRYWIDDNTITHEEQMRENNRLRRLADEHGFLKMYRLQLINTSKRSIPKNLIFVGCFHDVQPPQKEFVPYNNTNLRGFLWRYFDEEMIKQYCRTHMF